MIPEEEGGMEGGREGGREGCERGGGGAWGKSVAGVGTWLRRDS